MSCYDDKVVWKIEKSKDFNPHSLLFVPRVLLVADRVENRLVVLQPGTGMQVKTILLPGEVYDIHQIEEICLFNNQIIVISGRGHRDLISYFSLK